MIYKKDLTALKKHIRVIGKKVDNLLKAYEKEVKAKPAQKASAKKRATKLTATDKVLKIVNRSKKGVDNVTLMKKTGFDDKKLRNIIFRAYKEGKIQRVGRGLYIGVKATAPKVSKEKAVKAKPAMKAPSKEGATKLTATDQILKIVNASKKGVDIITIKKKTGFEDKKVRNIIFRANKEGKIQRAERGLYKGAK
jgi:predicted transcriptional regulator of viral defense system